MSNALQRQTALTSSSVSSTDSAIASVFASHGAQIILHRPSSVEQAEAAERQVRAAVERERGGAAVNCDCPDCTETALIVVKTQASTDSHDGDSAAGATDLLLAKQPRKRMTAPDDLAQQALRPCHRTAHTINGAANPADGGRTAR